MSSILIRSADFSASTLNSLSSVLIRSQISLPCPGVDLVDYALSKAEKSAERVRTELKESKAEAEKSSDTNLQNLYSRLVVSLSGASLLLGPMI